MLTITTQSYQETIDFGKWLAPLLPGGTLVLLKGDLAAGKTTLTKGLALGLSIHETVNSPTFVLMKEYEGDKTLVHIDAYRLEGLSQDLGFEDYLTEDSILVVEWPDYLNFKMDAKHQVVISFQLDSENQRTLTLTTSPDLEDSLKNAYTTFRHSL